MTCVMCQNVKERKALFYASKVLALLQQCPGYDKATLEDVEKLVAKLSERVK